jgi:hypothetical protein
MTPELTIHLLARGNSTKEEVAASQAVFRRRGIIRKGHVYGLIIYSVWIG